MHNINHYSAHLHSSLHNSIFIRVNTKRTSSEDPSLLEKGNAPTKSESGGGFLSQHLPWKKSKKNARNQEFEEVICYLKDHIFHNYK